MRLGVLKHKVRPLEGVARKPTRPPGGGAARKGGLEGRPNRLIKRVANDHEASTSCGQPCG